jgi:hypothetical protein
MAYGSSNAADVPSKNLLRRRAKQGAPRPPPHLVDFLPVM